MCTNWTWEYIADNMDIPRLLSMQSYWKDNPPIHLLIKAFMGIDTKSKPDIKENSQNISSMMSVMKMDTNKTNRIKPRMM